MYLIPTVTVMMDTRKKVILIRLPFSIPYYFVEWSKSCAPNNVKSVHDLDITVVTEQNLNKDKKALNHRIYCVEFIEGSNFESF